MNDAKTIGSNALVLDTAEENVTVMNAEESKLGKEVSLIEQRAEAVVVASGADFEDAGLFLKQIKQAQKQVKDYRRGAVRLQGHEGDHGLHRPDLRRAGDYQAHLQLQSIVIRRDSHGKERIPATAEEHGQRLPAG